jgi:hypothetical protein
VKWTNLDPWLTDLFDYSGYNAEKGAIKTADEIIYDPANL